MPPAGHELDAAARIAAADIVGEVGARNDENDEISSFLLGGRDGARILRLALGCYSLARSDRYMLCQPFKYDICDVVREIKFPVEDIQRSLSDEEKGPRFIFQRRKGSGELYTCILVELFDLVRTL